MARTYDVVATAVTFGNGKSMISIWNASGSSVVVKIRRVLLLNNQTVSGTGVLATLEFRKITAHSGGTALSALKRDMNDADMNASVSLATGATVTGGDLLRKILWSTDEPAISSSTIDEWETFVPLNYIWDAGYADSNVQPLTLRAGEGCHLKCTTNTTVMNVDIFVEVTEE